MEKINSEIFGDIYDRYYGSKNSSSNKKTLSSHWEYFSEQFIVERDDVGSIRRIYGIGFGNMITNNILVKTLIYIGHISYLIKLPFRLEIIKLAWISFGICKSMGFYFSFDCFKQVCALVTINKHITHEMKRKRLVFLMIGYGFLSSLIKESYPNSTLILVDIGKTLLFQTFYCQKAHPGKVHKTIFEFEENNLNMSSINKYDFIYCPADNLERITKLKYDVAINIASMQEMNMETIEKYFSFMRNAMNENNLFYCCNRELKVLRGGERLEFNKYPWRNDDIHLFDEYCPWYKYFLTGQKTKNGPKLLGFKIPYVSYFDGLLKHRLTILSTNSGKDNLEIK